MGAVHQVGIKINVDAKAASTEIPRAARELDALSASTKAAAQAAEKLERVRTVYGLLRVWRTW